MSLNGARLTWFGHATWLLETPGGKRVLIDPWFTGNPKTPTADPGAVDVMLLTHGHSDHTADVLRLAAEKKPKAVIGMLEMIDYFEMKGLENGVGMNKGGSTEAEGLRVTMTDAHHSSSFGEEDGTICGLCDICRGRPERPESFWEPIAQPEHRKKRKRRRRGRRRGPAPVRSHAPAAATTNGPRAEAPEQTDLPEDTGEVSGWTEGDAD